MTITKVTIVPPVNAYAGWEGRIYLSNGKVHRVQGVQAVEPYDYDESFQWDYFPFETEAECKRATIAKAKRMGWGRA
jgi:hypothetical protein